jgi:hypothetical protein
MTFPELEVALRDAIGHTLFTAMRYHVDTGDSERVYTSNAAAYPIGGRKAIVDSVWTRRVIREGRPFLGRTAADIREHFPDHALIASLGCGSIVNLPVRWEGRVLGSLNLLHREGWYDDAAVSTGLRFAALAAPAYLALRSRE